MADKPKLAVFKFASCDGCQLSLLDCEDELLAVADAVEIAYFLEARTQEIAGPYDVGLVEGSVTTAHDAQRIKDIRRQCKFLVTIGACATSGGIQALRNWANVKDYIQLVYAHPEYINTLATSTAIGDHVSVDFELRGCPINKHQLVDLVSSLLRGRKPSRAQLQRLCGVQAAAHGLRLRRARHRLHGPGHSGGLRRDLSRLQSRLFWMLRPQGTRQRGQSDPGLRAPGRRQRPCAATGPELQRLRPGIPPGERIAGGN